MRPQDIAILLKIISLNDPQWQIIQLANGIYISPSEISESLNRSLQASLIDHKKKRVNRQNLFEFLEHGLQYVFPQQPGSLTRGIPTAHSHADMKNKFISEINYVWPDNNAKEIGLAIEPFYPKQVKAVGEDLAYYKMLSLVDVLRVGKTREIKYAVGELKKMILNEPQN